MADEPVNGQLIARAEWESDPTVPLSIGDEAMAASLAIGESQAKIARQKGVTGPAVSIYLKKHPEITDRANHLRAVMTQMMLEHGSANRLNRLSAYQDILDKLKQIVDERAAAAMSDPEAQMTPGASTGLITQVVKKIGYGKIAERIVEWKMDDSVFKALMTVTERMARETGQWSEKTESKTETVVRVFHGNEELEF